MPYYSCWCELGTPVIKGTVQNMDSGLDHGLDCGLDSGLNNGLNIWTTVLITSFDHQGSEVTPNTQQRWVITWWHHNNRRDWYQSTILRQ